MDIRFFEGYAKKRKYTAGQPILHPNGLRELYAVLWGTVDVYDASAQIVKTLGQGRCFNERFYFFGDDSATHIARDNVEVYCLDNAAFMAVCNAYPLLGIEMMREISASQGEFPLLDAQPLLDYEKTQAWRSLIQTNPPHAPGKRAGTRHHGNQSQAEGQSLLKETGHQNAQSALLTKTVVLYEQAVQESAPLQAPAKALTVPYAEPPSFFLEGHSGYPDISHPEYMQLLFEKEYVCPYCGKSFKTYKVMKSKLVETYATRYDLRRYYKDFKREWYDVLTCQFCYFSTLIDRFMDPENFTRSLIKKQLTTAKEEVLLDFQEERNLDFVFASHYIALQCAPAFLAHRHITAKLWLNLSWLYEDTGDAKMEQKAIYKAIEAHERLYLESTLPPSQEQAAALTIAGLLYRAKELAEIRKWLFEVKKIKYGKRVFNDLADQLMELVKKQRENA